MNKTLHALIDPRDGGLASRKFVFAVGTSIAIFLGGLIAAAWAKFGPSYEVMISGLLGCLGLYLGGNISSKWMTARQMKAAGDAAPDGKPELPEHKEESHD